MVNISILFLVFNRLDTTTRVFERISEIKPSKLYIACDGARSNKIGEDVIVNQVRNFLTSNINWPCEVKTLFRDKNLGCKNAVSGAIDWFFQHEEMGIILEDDCLPDITFFKYCEELLNRYKDDERVFCISGNNFTGQELYGKDSYYFSRFPHIWGWATWRRAWRKYDLDMNTWSAFKQASLLDSCTYSFFNKKYFEAVFESVAMKKIDTWDYQWVFTCMKNNGFTIIPRVNLVTNIGFDARATHTVTTPSFSLDSSKLEFPLSHPTFVINNIQMDRISAKKHFSKSLISILKSTIKNKLREFTS